MSETPATTQVAASMTPTSHQPTPTVAPASTERSDDEKHLQSIFPDVDETTIHDCYVLCERNVERTVEFLLGTDHTDPPNNTNAVTPGMSQSEMDEQLARQFEQEELAAAAAVWNPRAAGPPAPNSGHTNTNYRSQEPQGASGSNEPNLQEQFNKFAETGKKTITSIFNMVKEKIKEFEAPPPGGSSNPQMQQQHHQYYAPEPASTTPHRQAQASSPTPYQTYAPPTAPPPGVPPQNPTSTPGMTLSNFADPVTTSHPTTSTSPTPATPPPNLDLSKTAFLPRKPAPVPESKPEDLTESPFEDRNR